MNSIKNSWLVTWVFCRLPNGGGQVVEEGISDWQIKKVNILK